MQHVMFDVDGTLVNSYEFDEACFIAAVDDVLGHAIDSDWESYPHVTDAGILDEHLQRVGMLSKREQVHRDVKSCFFANIRTQLREAPASEVTGAAEFVAKLRAHNEVSLSIATGGWLETAHLKLESAGIDISNIPIASSNDHHSRTEIMKVARHKARVDTNCTVTYFGDAAWDLRACQELGFNFVLVGNRTNHVKALDDFRDFDTALELIGL